MLRCDAAFDGIGAAIFHPSDNGPDRPIAFMSRVLQPAEKNYSATDREALAIYFGVSKFSQYLLGRKFTLLTDHKPLVTIFGKKKGIPAMAAGRLQRWSVFLSNFDFDIQHINGKDNVNADFLSRFTDRHEKVEFDVSYLNFIAGNFKEMLSRKDIQHESLADPVIKRIIYALRNGWTMEMKNNSELKPFFQRTEELTIEDNIVMWGYRVVIPKKLQSVLLKTLHSTHSGIVKMKARARSFFWWPMMDKEIGNVSGSCVQC